jgi:DNA polymerase elongation subunit (family B)
MATLVLDIETVGESWDSFDDTTKSALTNWIAQATHSKVDFEKEIARVKNQLSFSPLTGQVVALGMYDLERSRGAVYYVGDSPIESYTEGEFTYKARTEKELLEDFWEGARSYDVFVTFNGRAFDLPFLIHRSAICGVRSDTTLLGQRYLNRQAPPYHVDLLDELTFYGTMKRQSLHMYCRAYGIPSPKREGGGAEVSELFQTGRLRDLATYNARDVIATTELYKKWKQYLAPASFINAIEL